MTFSYEHDGYCPCCDTRQIFKCASDEYRDELVCATCHSVVRERALALVLSEILPHWRTLAIHESSPADRGISKRLAADAPYYLASHYYPAHPLGATIDGYRNEDLENQTFADESFDLVVTLDVMEHVFRPDKVYREIHRTLKGGGYYLHTFPIRKDRVEAWTPRAVRNPDGSMDHLGNVPEYHRNPIDEEGALVACDYGYGISRRITEWAPFDVRITRFWDETHGIIGEYTEVVVCRKRRGSTPSRGRPHQPESEKGLDLARG